MDTLTYSAARSRFADTMNQVCQNHMPIIITRGSADPVVMLSLEDYNSMQETTYLMASPKNASRLMDSVNEVEAMLAAKKKK
jgi:antitoxin YefM